MLISNDRPSLHLWLKENFLKHCKVSKYYATDSLKAFLFASFLVKRKFFKRLRKLKTFLLLFMLLVTINFVKNSHI